MSGFVRLALSIFAFLFLSVLTVSCTKTEKEVRYLPAPQDMTKSFSKTTDCKSHQCLELNKSSLGKKFILITTAKSNGVIPQWEDFKPYSVVFEKSGNRLGMFTFPPMTAIDLDVQKELLQTFEILDEGDDSLVVDWSGGLKSMRFEANYEDDGPQTEDSPTERTSAMVVDSLVRKLDLNQDYLEVEQFSKVIYSYIKNRRKDFFEKDSARLPALETQEGSYLLNVRLYPDLEAKNFVSKEADPTRHIGYFTYGKAFEGLADTSERLIMKWDTDPAKGMITYYITSTTPDLYVEEVKQGVLYWNKVFGQNVFTVQTGANPNMIPPLHSVVIRWLPWEDAGYAYANIQAHPLTGEILRGQIYMTPAFAQTKGKKERLLPVLKPSAFCDLRGKAKGVRDLGLNISDDYPDNPIDLKLAKDNVLETIAHEVGHTVGLRHNFGASYFAKPDTYKMYEEVRKYLRGETIAGFESVASVMDYVGGSQELVMANYIKTNALSYDRIAIEWGYKKPAASVAEVLAQESQEIQRDFTYCDDDDLTLAEQRDKKAIFECSQFDPAGNYFIAYLNSHLKMRANLLQEHFNELIETIAGKGTGLNLERFLANQDLKMDLESLTNLLRFDDKKSNYVSLKFFKEVLSAGYEHGEDTEVKAILADQLAKAGGLDKINSLICPKSNSWIVDQMTAVLAQIEKSQMSEQQKQLLNVYFQTTAEEQEKTYTAALLELHLCKP